MRAGEMKWSVHYAKGTKSLHYTCMRANTQSFFCLTAIDFTFLFTPKGALSSFPHGTDSLSNKKGWVFTKEGGPSVYKQG